MNMENKKRVRWTTSVNPDLLDKVKQLSDKTRIPVSKLTDEALENLLIKHKAIRTPKTTTKPPIKKAEKTEG